MYNFTERFDPDELFGDRLLNFQAKLQSISRTGDSFSQILALEELRNQADIYESNLRTTYRQLMREDDELLINIPEQEALRDIGYEANQILDEEMWKAVLTNREFNHPMFTDRLTEAIFDARTIRLSVINHNLKIVIDLNTTAGKLSDWAEAVKAARNVFTKQKSQGKGKQPKELRTPEPLRSHMWAEKFYIPAREGGSVYRRTKKGTKDITEQQIEKYFRTMNLRFQLCKSKAPFWHILNHGIAEYNDKTGGTAYPANIPTNFVRKAAEEIQRRYRQLKSIYSKQISQEYNRIRNLYITRLNQVENLLDAIDTKIRALQNRREPTGPKYQEEMDFLKKHLGEERFLRADRAKLLYLARALQEEQYIPPRIGLGGNVRTRTIRMVRRYRKGY